MPTAVFYCRQSSEKYLANRRKNIFITNLKKYLQKVFFTAIKIAQSLFMKLVLQIRAKTTINNKSAQKNL